MQKPTRLNNLSSSSERQRWEISLQCMRHHDNYWERIHAWAKCSVVGRQEKVIVRLAACHFPGDGCSEFNWWVTPPNRAWSLENTVRFLSESTFTSSLLQFCLLWSLAVLFAVIPNNSSMKYSYHSEDRGASSRPRDFLYIQNPVALIK